MAFDAGSIFGRLNLDRSGFSAGILEAQGLTSLLGNTISSFLGNPLVGVANVAKGAVSGIAGLVTGVADAGDQFAKLSQSTGASVEWLSGLKYAGDMAGTGLEQISQSMSILVNNASAAVANAGSPAAAAFAKLGVAVRGADGSMRSTQDMFMEAADGLAGISNATERAALAQDIFGKSGASMLPMLKDGSGGIQEMIDKANELGITMTGPQAAAAEQFNDALSDVQASFKGLFQSIADRKSVV